LSKRNFPIIIPDGGLIILPVNAGMISIRPRTPSRKTPHPMRGMGWDGGHRGKKDSKRIYPNAVK